jgi:REP element-mobilizing transposase RayT
LITRKNIRLKGRDYSGDGYYFITICSHKRNPLFFRDVGEGLASSRKGSKLSPLGKIIDTQWNDIPNQFDHVELDVYTIMPNHIHGIFIIKNGNSQREDARPSPTLPGIMCSFKSKCTNEYIKYIQQRKLDISATIWQRLFYDHIIRNERSLIAIREYIADNPVNWEQDIDDLINL